MHPLPVWDLSVGRAGERQTRLKLTRRGFVPLHARARMDPIDVQARMEDTARSLIQAYPLAPGLTSVSDGASSPCGLAAPPAALPGLPAPLSA